MSLTHPRPNDQGQPVIIKHPSSPTPLANWASADALATATPGCALPVALHGTPFAPWASTPQSAAEWASVDGADASLHEPPLATSAGRKASAGVVIREPDGRVWIVAPTNAFGGYQWTFPKGTCDKGMPLQATAIREAWEESGLQVRITGVLGDFTRTTSVCRLYLAERVGGTPADMGWESQAVSLVPLAALEGLLNGAADKPVIQALLTREN